MVDVLTFDDAAAVIDEISRGGGEPDRRSCPLVIVDLDSTPNQPDRALAPPATLPLVLVGVTRSSTPACPVSGPDLLIAAGSDTPNPWVPASRGVEMEIEAIESVVSAHAHAATTLVQVLRVSERLTVDSALVVESLAYATLQAGPDHRRWLEVSSRPVPDDDPSPVVLLDRRENRLAVRLNRPSRRNAYSARMRDELIEALAVAALDASIQSLELRGDGPNFCSGGDLAEFGAVHDVSTAHQIRMARSTGSWLNRLKARTEVYVHGSCVGAGVELPAFAGRVVAAPDTTFSLPEVSMGLIPGAGGTASIPRRIGRQRAAWLALTGREIDAGTAAAWGLVDDVSGRIPRDERP